MGVFLNTIDPHFSEAPQVTIWQSPFEILSSVCNQRVGLSSVSVGDCTIHVLWVCAAAAGSVGRRPGNSMVPSYRPPQSQGLRNGSLSQLVPGSGEGQHRTVEPSFREALGQGACVHSKPTAPERCTTDTHATRSVSSMSTARMVAADIPLWVQFRNGLACSCPDQAAVGKRRGSKGCLRVRR